MGDADLEVLGLLQNLAPAPMSQPRAAALLDAARPSSIVVRPHDVEIAFDGALVDLDRIGAAIELAAHWACDARAIGPYR